jgi:hypothetical protein
VRERTDDIHARHRSAVLSRMGEALPGLLRDLRVALEVSPDLSPGTGAVLPCIYQQQ